MLSQVEQDAAALWMHEPSAGWSDDLGTIGVVSKRGDALFSSANDGLLDKLNDDKLARDVEDLSAIFEELEDGVVDFPLPCDEVVATGAEVTGDWIGDLEKDVVNVDELSSMFDTLVAEQETAMEASVGTDESMVESDEEEYDDDDDSDLGGVHGAFVPAPPVWAAAAPLDPRSVIRTQVFKNLDSRIPKVNIPRMDLGFGAPSFTLKPVTRIPSSAPVASVSPKSSVERKASPKAAMESKYLHDPASCWICKSDKSAYKKYALHRYLEKRHRRNWKRGPRYSGRSNVATNRVREGGRFVTTALWV